MAKTNKVTVLTERIALLQQQIADCTSAIAEDGADMTDEQLDQVARDRTVAQTRLVALQAALAGEQGKSAASVIQAAQEARQSAGKAVAKAALDRADAAADIDGSITALVAAIQRYDVLNTTMRLAAFAAGLTDGNTRAYSTDLRPVSAVLADTLSRSGIAAKLDFVAVHGVQHTDGKTSVADLTARTNAKLLAAVERAGAA